MTANQFTRRRKKLFRSQQQAADALGVRQCAVGHWETGRNPVPKYIIKLLDCLVKLEEWEKIAIENGLVLQIQGNQILAKPHG